MTILGKVSYAYASEILPGSCFTAPLRGYEGWFAQRIQDSEGCCAQVAWRIAQVVSAIFAYLLLAIPTAVGIVINLFAPLPTDLDLIVRGEDRTLIAPPKGGYSEWAIAAGLPQATQHFVKGLGLKYLCTHSGDSMQAYSSGYTTMGCTAELSRVASQYTYDQQAFVGYLLYNSSSKTRSLPAPFSEHRELQLACFNHSQRSQHSLSLMPGISQSLAIVPEQGFPTFEEQCEQFNQQIDRLSARLNWIPTTYDTRSYNGYTLVVIPLPDQLILNMQRADPTAQLRLDRAPPPLLLQSSGPIIEEVD